MRARLRPGHLAVAAAVVGAAVFGCQAIVSGDLPDYHCASTDPSACPQGKTCDLVTGRCVDPGTEDDGGGDLDGGGDDGPNAPDVDAGPASVGTPCRVDAECASNLCGTSTILTTAIVASTGPVCTSACCTSEDCAAGFVCFGTGTGGNYCVKAEAAQRQAPSGSKTAGASCTTNRDCRSASCVSNKCLDTCCRAADCTNGAICRFRPNAPPPSHDGWVCEDPVPGATRDVGDVCGSGADAGVCRNDNCLPVASGSCRAPCCGKTSCGGGRCIVGTSNSDFFKFCVGPGSGTVPVGQPCQTENECTTGFCDFELKKCADLCCEDSDCPKGQVCRPAAQSTPFLRCVTK